MKNTFLLPFNLRLFHVCFLLSTDYPIPLLADPIFLLEPSSSPCQVFCIEYIFLLKNSFLTSQSLVFAQSNSETRRINNMKVDGIEREA